MSFMTAFAEWSRGDAGSAEPLPAPRVLVFGDSHVHAVQEALKARGDRLPGVSIEARRLLKTKLDPSGPPVPQSPIDRLRRLGRKLLGATPADERESRTRTLGDTTLPAFLMMAKSLKSSDILVSTVGGNKHAVFSTIQHPIPFDFHFPEDKAPAAVSGGAQIIPYKPLAEHFEDVLRRSDGATLAALKQATRARVVHLMAPPPKRDGGFLQRHHDTQFAAEGIGSLGVSDASLRMKFWKLQYRVLTVMCAELEIELVPPPTEACDHDGFLDEAFYAQDATHANRKYGALVIAQLERIAMDSTT